MHFSIFFLRHYILNKNKILNEYVKRFRKIYKYFSYITTVYTFVEHLQCARNCTLRLSIYALCNSSYNPIKLYISFYILNMRKLILREIKLLARTPDLINTEGVLSARLPCL